MGVSRGEVRGVQTAAHTGSLADVREGRHGRKAESGDRAQVAADDAVLSVEVKHTMAMDGPASEIDYHH